MRPGTRIEGEHHVIHVYPSSDGDWLERDLFHPGGCARVDGVCWVEEMADNYGWEDLFHEYEPGLHRVVPFAVEGGWVTGDHAVEGDCGVEDAGDPADWAEPCPVGRAEWSPYGTWDAVEEWAWAQELAAGRPHDIGEGF